MLVTSSFSTQTSYENQTKKAITNKFVQDAMTEFLRQQLEVYFIENPRRRGEDRRAGAGQQAQPGDARKRPVSTSRRSSPSSIDIANRVQKFVDCRTKDVSRREIYIVEGDSALGACKQSRDAEFQGHYACPGQDPQLPEGGL